MKQKAFAQVLKFAVALSSFTLVACSSDEIPEAQRTRRAPASTGEAGVNVAARLTREAPALKAKIVTLLKENPELSVRVVDPNHGLYELHGTTVAALKKQFPSADYIVERNQFIRLNLTGSDPVDDNTPVPDEDEEVDLESILIQNLGTHPFIDLIERTQGIQVEGAAKDFISACKLNPVLAPVLNVEDNQGRDRTGASIFFEIEETLKLSAKGSQPRGQAKTLTYAWIMTAPDRSLLAPRIEFKDQVEYTSDSTGLHIYSVVAKDEFGFCRIDIKPFYVTANPIFQPEKILPDSLAEKIKADSFWHLFHIGVPDSWQKSLGLDLIVGIIDSGVDYNHPALAANILVNEKEIQRNGVDDDGNGYVDDYAGYDFGQDDFSPFDDYGHGTHVAGIAASQVFGAARKAKILPTKFGAGLGLDIASVVGAIRYSVDRGAKVLNMSFGFDEDHETVRAAIAYAESKDVLVVAAAGNETANNDITSIYPANYANANVLVIAASDEQDKLTFYSNFGKRVHLAAPGGTLEKPIMSSYKKNPSEQEYAGLMGTSMASPLVAGVAAQVWAVNPALTAPQVKALLVNSGRETPGLAGRILSGKVVDARAAVQLAAEPGPESSLVP